MYPFLPSSAMSGYGQNQNMYNQPQGGYNQPQGGYNQPPQGGYNQGPGGQYNRPPAPGGGSAVQQLTVPILIGAAGCLIVVIGAFLGWSSAELMGETESTKGTEGDGLYTLLASGLAGVLLLAGLGMKNIKIAAASLLPTLITAVFAVLNVISPDRAVRAEAEDEGLPSDQVDAFLETIDISAGVGIWMTLIGMLVALAVGGYVASKARTV